MAKESMTITKTKNDDSFVEQIRERQNLIDKLNTEKGSKDIYLKNIKELEEHARAVKQEIVNLNYEIEGKHKAISALDEEVKSKNYNLNRLQEAFDKKNLDKIRSFEQKLKDVEMSDMEYKRLIIEHNSKIKTLNSELAKVNEERGVLKLEMSNNVRNSNDVLSQANRKEHDILEREHKIKEEIAAFEKEKEELRPEMTRVSSIKNENKMLLQRIDEEKASLENHRKMFELQKEKMATDLKMEKDVLKNKMDSIITENGRLAKWEQDLKDFELEVRAQQSEAQKQMKRYQLKQIVDSKE